MVNSQVGTFICMVFKANTPNSRSREHFFSCHKVLLVFSGNEISQILFLFVMPFVIKVKKRPLWTAIGVCCTGLGCIIMAIPHFLPGRNLHRPVAPADNTTQDVSFRQKTSKTKFYRLPAAEVSPKYSGEITILTLV